MNCTIIQGQEDWGVKLASSEFKSKRVIPPPPEAAALGKYGNVPLSFFTGTPGISIPLYQYSGNTLSLPIQLSYNAGGFNPQEIAPWTGIGWALNAGGMITRSVSGNPDVLTNYFISPSPLLLPNQFTDPYGYYAHMEDIRKGYMEAQPDMYYFNFAGRTGKFLVKPDGSVLKKEKNNYIITANVSGTVGSSITIKDEKGITYQFFEVEISDLTQDDMSTDVPAHSFSYPSTWHLSKIVSADGFEEIEFLYHTIPLYHYQYINYPQTEAYVYEENINHTSGGTSFTGPISRYSQPPTVRTKRKYLQKINFKRTGELIAYIDFISSVNQRQDLHHLETSGFPGERLLDSIKVYSKKLPESFVLTKQYKLNYAYFTNSGNSQWQFKRLRLENVQEFPVTSGTVTPPPYAFEYNNNGLMPSLSTTHLDHWGFYNLGNGTQTLVPSHNISNGNFNITAANRNPSLTGSSAYLLNKIKYPTGGYTSFEYELHQAYDVQTSSTINVGGVRIKKLIDYSFNNKKAQEHNYEYILLNGTTSGKAMRPSYFSSSNYRSLGSSGSGWASVCSDQLLSEKNTYTISASSVIGLGSIQGSHIGYSCVTEFLSDVNNTQPLGKTVYDYHVASGTWDSHDDDIANGDLLKKSVYDNGGKIIEEVVNSYNYFQNGGLTAIVAGIANSQDNKSTLVKMYTASLGTYFGWYMHPSCATNVVDSKIYNVKFTTAGWSVTSREKQLVQQVIKQYSQQNNSFLTSTKKFYYGNTAHTLPTKVEQTTSANVEVVTENKYPLDYIIPTSGTLDNTTLGIKLLKDKNILTEIETVQYRQNSNGTNKLYIGGLITNYSPIIPHPSSLERLELTAPLTSFTLSQTTNGTFTKNANYKPLGGFSYNSNGTLSEQNKEQDVKTAYIWDYDNQYTTAEVSNAFSSQIAYTSFETNSTGGWSSIPNLTTNRVLTGGVTGKYSYTLVSGSNITKTSLPSTKQYIVTYWSKNSNVTVTTNIGSAASVTGATRNEWTYYEHLLPLNSTSVTLSVSSNNNIDELRLYPKDGFMNTVAYDPGIGIISQCSFSNEIKNFEYDGLGRLINLRDEDGFIIKNFKYNFASDNTAITGSSQSLFYSAAQSITKTKNNCTTGQGTAVTYIVPYGKYISHVNQTIANNYAISDRDNNSQSYANANGQCVFYNVTKSGRFFKNNCLPSEGYGSRVTYTVAAGTYSSLNSQAEADAAAQADVDANGQAYANATGTCSCAAEGTKFINNICETGTRYNSSSVFIGNGQYQCTYYYQFSDGSISSSYTETLSYSCPVY